MTVEFRNTYSETGLQEFLAGRDSTLGQSYPFYPLDSPGFPKAGKNFTSHATALAGTPDDYTPEDASDMKASELKRTRKAVFNRAVFRNLTGLYYRALYDDEFQINVEAANRPWPVNFILGHKWGEEADGPRAARVMVVGKNPGREEAEEKRNYVGPTSILFREILEELGFTDLGHWYMTNVSRFPNPLAHQTSEVAAAWINDCLPLLHQELRLVRPDYLLLLGSEAISAVLGKGNNYKSTNGRVNILQLPLHDRDQEPEYKDVQVVTSIHPAAVSHDPSKRDDLYKALRYFRSVVDGTLALARDPEIDREHLLVQDAGTLDRLANRLEGENRTEFAIDCEFDGDTPIDGKLHTVQFSWAEKTACVVNLRDVQAQPSFGGGMETASRILTRIFKGRNKRIIGHYFNADLWWLKQFGLWFLEEQFETPGDDPDPDGETRLFGWQKTRTQGGFDTILAGHSHEETSDLGLKELSIKHTTVGNYEVELDKWKREEAKRLGVGVTQLPGFGACPRDILNGVPYQDTPFGQLVRNSYGGTDADATFRLFKLYNERGPGGGPALLDRDRFGHCSRVPFWISMRACLAAYEMHETGVSVDLARSEELFELYTDVKCRLINEIREMISWPGFNPSSLIQCKELVFGHEYNGKLNKVTGETMSVRPLGAITLNLSPYKSTGKRPKLWDDIRTRQKEHEFTPAVDKETFEVYKHLHPAVEHLLHIRYIQQITRSVLQPPKRTYDDSDWELDEDGNRIYERGLLSYRTSQGKVHTNISQTKETGRMSSWQPPLQNLSKKREPDYKKICGGSYKHPLRSIITAPEPERGEEPMVIVSADYTGAELLGMAIQAGSQQMIDHCQRALLPDSGYSEEGVRCSHGEGGKPLKKCKECAYPHPNYYDIHANVAVKAFRPFNAKRGQPCRDGRLARYDLKEAGLSHYRDAAKPVDFGYAYGMTADAAYRRAREGGADVTKEDSQALLDGLEALYPELPPYYAEAARRSQDPCYIVNCFGRRRRTYRTTDLKAIGDIERQFKNFPIQSLVADAMSLAIANFREYRRQHSHLRYRLSLAVHDDAISLVPVSQVAEYYDEVIPKCMTDDVDVWPCDLEGNLRDDPNAPYHLTPDRHVYLRWGVGITKEEAEAIGLPPRFVGS